MCESKSWHKNVTVKLITGLENIAEDYDAVICDIWGVLHDGAHVYPEACDALRRFRHNFGRVVLLSNAPRPPADTARQLASMGMPEGCYDDIVTSGGASREDLAKRCADHPLKLLHIGPDRDKAIYLGLDIELTGPEEAEVLLLTGLDDHDTETPDDYAGILAECNKHNLPAICANPDIQVPINGKIVWCAGALAQAYENIGGAVTYYGKPHLPVYKLAEMEAASRKKILAIGDALATDIAGATRAGIDTLFIAGGLHAKEIGPLTEESVSAFFEGRDTTVCAAMAMLAW